MNSSHQLLPRRCSGLSATALCCLLAASAEAQPAVQSSPAPSPSKLLVDLASLRLRYGLVVRKGYQDDQGPGQTYSGVTSNDFGVATAFFGDRKLGASLSLQREGFSLQASEGTLTKAALWRVQVAPAARFDLGPARLHVLAGYGFAQLPFLPAALPSSPSQSLFGVGRRHAVLLASRGLIRSLPFGMFAEASVEVPITLSARAPSGENADSSGFAAGCALGLPLGRTERVGYAIALDYQYLWDRLAVSGMPASGSNQSLSRVGLSLELTWLDGRASVSSLKDQLRPPVPGALAITLLDKETAQPITQAKVVVAEATYHPGPSGTLNVAHLEPGHVQISVEAPDYQPAQEDASIVSGKTARLPIVLVKSVQPKLATLSGLIRSTLGGKRVPATLEIPENKFKTQADVNGAFVLQLEGGTYHIIISAPGYIAQTKRVTLSEGDQAIFNVDLHPQSH